MRAVHPSNRGHTFHQSAISNDLPSSLCSPEARSLMFAWTPQSRLKVSAVQSMLLWAGVLGIQIHLHWCSGSSFRRVTIYYMHVLSWKMIMDLDRYVCLPFTVHLIFTVFVTVAQIVLDLLLEQLLTLFVCMVVLMTTHLTGESLHGCSISNNEMWLVRAVLFDLDPEERIVYLV